VVCRSLPGRTVSGERPASMKPRSRRFRLDRADLGDGKPVRAWIVIDAAGVTVYKFGSRRKWWVPIAEAATLLSRRGQLRAVQARMGEPGQMGSKLKTADE